MPSVLSILIIGLVFTSILNPKVGILNETLRTVGLDSMTSSGLRIPKIAFWSVMAVDIWRHRLYYDNADCRDSGNSQGVL